MILRAVLCLAAISVVLVGSLHGDDWPMWRYDAGRTAASSEELPNNLKLLWSRNFKQRQQAWDDPLNLDLMTYDRIFEPIVVDGKLLIGFNDRDKLAAFDADTGEPLWSFYADAPVRLPAAAWQGRVFFCSDDGFLYCLDVDNGKLLWKFHGAPSSQKALGNQRLASAWPARGGPVVRDDTVYFAASIWPFMGVFIYALDAESGEVQWINDGTGAQYLKQPHGAPSFAGVAPQGALVATEKLLLVPGGRSVPAAYSRDDGAFQYFEINAGGKGTGGSFVAADENHFFVHTRLKGTRAFQLNNGVKTAFTPNEPVLSDGFVYSAEKDGKRAIVQAYRRIKKVAWKIEADGTGDLIRAGNCLYAAGGGKLSAIRLPKGKGKAKVVWQMDVPNDVERLLAADGKLFAVTMEGAVMAFGVGGSKAKQNANAPVRLAVSAESDNIASRLLESGNAQGYAIWFGAEDAALIDAVAARSPFVQLAIVDDNSTTVDQLRRRFDAAGLYGRVTAHRSDPLSFGPPKYVANMVFVGREMAKSANGQMIESLYESVRPYGGVLHLLAENADRQQLASAAAALDLEQAKVEITSDGVLIRRAGALPGSADWTHQYGDIANTIKSDDERVKLPLGILWFGGSSNMDVLPRHGHGPPEQVVGGRLFIQGMNSLSARDVYTGRVLWKREFEDLGTFDVYYDATYENTPLDPKYNQVHIPGANGRGVNYVATDDRVYLLEGAVCHVLDPATGKTIQDITLPKDDEGKQREWGYLGVYQDVLIGGLGFARYRDRHNLAFEEDNQLRRSRAGFGSKSLDRAASQALIGFDRHSGEQLWKIDANHSFWHNGVVAGDGKIFCLDKNPKLIEDALKRRGLDQPDTYRIAAFDYRTGEKHWEVNERVFGTWLGYSEEKDLLLQAGAAASDRLYAEVAAGMAVYHGRDGSLRWRNDDIKYAGPCILHNEWIITNANSYSESAGAFRLDNGKQKLIANPLTGELQPWKITRAYGCNSVIASENLLTFRSGAAGFYDLVNESGTGNFGGFKSGCTSNLVVANGVLNAPDYTRTCSCAYQNQTSLAMVHMPDLEMEMWTVNLAAAMESDRKTIEKLGINFGAPGDRRDVRGLLWLEYPIVGGASPPLNVEFDAKPQFFRHHSSSIPGSDWPWVLASGVEGVKEIRIGMRLEKPASLQSGIPVSHADDDAEENRSNGQVSLGSSDLEMVTESAEQIVGMRFANLNLARGAPIRHAYIQFTCDEPTTEPTSLTIAAEDSAEAKRFTSDRKNISSRKRTDVEVNWSPAAWTKPGEAGEKQRTPDLAPLIRKIVSRDDWKPGSAMAFFISGEGKRVAEASRGRGGNAARLVIDADEVDGAAANDKPASAHRVRLLFAASHAPDFGKRVFDIYLQGKLVLSDVAIDPAAGKPWAIHTLEAVEIGEELRIRLAPKVGEPVLSGVEILRQSPILRD